MYNLVYNEFRLCSVSGSSGPGGTERTGFDPKGTEIAGILRISKGICTLVLGVLDAPTLLVILIQNNNQASPSVPSQGGTSISLLHQSSSKMVRATSRCARSGPTCSHHRMPAYPHRGPRAKKIKVKKYHNELWKLIKCILGHDFQP